MYYAEFILYLFKKFGSNLLIIYRGPEKSKFMRQKITIYKLFRSGSSFCDRGIFSGSVNQKVGTAFNIFYPFPIQPRHSYINILSPKSIFINSKLYNLFLGLTHRKRIEKVRYFKRLFFSHKIQNQNKFLITCNHNCYGKPGSALISCVTKSNGRRIYSNIKAAIVRSFKF